MALALEIDPAVDLSVLAPRLGSYDQAHLTRAFVEMLGETPGAYAARSAAARANPVPTSPAPTSPVRTSTAGSS